MEVTTNDGVDVVIHVLQQTGGLSDLRRDQDFYDAGVTSVMALPILMELESRFGVTIPDDQFIEARTPEALYRIIANLREEARG